MSDNEKMYMEKLLLLNDVVNKFIDEADIYSDGKEELRYRWQRFHSGAICNWNYSHPNETD